MNLFIVDVGKHEVLYRQSELVKNYELADRQSKLYEMARRACSGGDGFRKEFVKIGTGRNFLHGLAAEMYVKFKQVYDDNPNAEEFNYYNREIRMHKYGNDKYGKSETDEEIKWWVYGNCINQRQIFDITGCFVVTTLREFKFKSKSGLELTGTVWRDIYAVDKNKAFQWMMNIDV